jgi:hypothetical protein
MLHGLTRSLITAIIKIFGGAQPMTDQEPRQHGGRRAGAGRKPTLKLLSVLRLVDPQIREQLAELTAHQREASGNPLLSQEQVVAMLIQAAYNQRALERTRQAAAMSPAMSSPALEYADNQDGDQLMSSALRPSELEIPDNQDEHHAADSHLAPGAAAIALIRGEINELLATLRRKNSVGQREGRRLLGLLTELIPLHAAQIIPWALLEELDRAHTDDADRDQALARLLERPLAEYRQDGWERDLGVYAAHLAAGPIRRQAEQWAFINLAVEISSATMVTNDRIADLTARVRAKDIDPTRWLLADQAAGVPQAPAAASGLPARPRPAPRHSARDEITGVRVQQGKSHYLGSPGKTFCGHALPLDPDDATWIRDADFKPTCRRCQALFRPVIQRGWPR